MKHFRLLAIVLPVFLSACATEGEPQEEIEWSAQWFQCESRFDCTAVYDAYCKYSGVNTTYLRIYQDWARQQVERAGELIPCEPVGDDKPLAAYCRSGRCEYP
ncbi:MAG: hypothetical protein WBM54_12370 [Woeseia sp.]